MLKNVLYLQRFKIISYRLYSDKSKLKKLLMYKDPTTLDPDKELFGNTRRKENVTLAVEGEIDKLDRLSDMPETYRKHRVARIYQRSKNVMQQGTDNTKQWVLEFGTETRWENPLMGWCSSGNSLSNIHMEFPSMCSAICFAEKRGFKWFHDKPHVKKEFKKSYSDNFTWNKRTRVSTK